MEPDNITTNSPEPKTLGQLAIRLRLLHSIASGLDAVTDLGDPDNACDLQNARTAVGNLLHKHAMLLAATGFSEQQYLKLTGHHSPVGG